MNIVNEVTKIMDNLIQADRDKDALYTTQCEQLEKKLEIIHHTFSQILGLKGRALNTQEEKCTRYAIADAAVDVAHYIDSEQRVHHISINCVPPKMSGIDMKFTPKAINTNKAVLEHGNERVVDFFARLSVQPALTGALIEACRTRREEDAE